VQSFCEIRLFVKSAWALRREMMADPKDDDEESCTIKAIRRLLTAQDGTGSAQLRTRIIAPVLSGAGTP
jgi:hypothetical protein